MVFWPGPPNYPYYLGKGYGGSSSVKLTTARKTFFNIPYEGEKGVWKSKTDTFFDRGVHVTQVS